MNKRTKKQQLEVTRALIKLCRKFKCSMSVDKELMLVSGGPAIISVDFDKALVQNNALQHEEGCKTVTLNSITQN